MTSMNSVRKGFVLSLGPISVATRLYSVIPSNKGSRNRLLCAQHKEPVKQKYVCSVDGKVLEYDDIVKGVEVSSGTFKVYSETEAPEIEPADGFDFTPVPAADFHNACLPGSQLYYLQLDGIGAQAWELLYRLAQDSKRVLVAKGALRKNQPKLYRLTTFNDFLVLQEFVFPEDVRKAPERDPVTLGRDMLKVAKQFLDAAEVEWEKFDAADDRRVAFQEWLEAHSETVTVSEPTDDNVQESNVVDLMDALKKSVDATVKKAKKGAS